MNGILLINKPEGITSRDVVNIAIKKLGIKKIGHTGTLDPIATGVMVLCVGKATKLVNLLTSEDKEYIAEVTLGKKTDTLDITGKVLDSKYCSVSRERLVDALNSFRGKYKQEVPNYSAVKIQGKKLYEYARSNAFIKLPKREVEVKNIKLINFNSENNTFSFKCLVSKGTYIRSLIRDICNRLDVIGTMSKLTRTKQGKFKIDDCICVDDVCLNSIIDVKDIIDLPIIKVDNALKKKILNGQILDNIYYNENILFVDELDNVLAIYKMYEKDYNKIKPYVMLYERED